MLFLSVCLSPLFPFILSFAILSLYNLPPSPSFLMVHFQSHYLFCSSLQFSLYVSDLCYSVCECLMTTVCTSSPKITYFHNTRLFLQTFRVFVFCLGFMLSTIIKVEMISLNQFANILLTQKRPDHDGKLYICGFLWPILTFFNGKRIII